MAPQFQSVMVWSAILFLVIQKAYSKQDKTVLGNLNKKEIPYHLDKSLLTSLNISKWPIRFERATGGGISVVHLRLNDNDPYALVQYAGSVIFVLTYALDGAGNVFRTQLYRGTNYGEEITSINGQLDPSHPNPVLSTNVYISDEDYRIAAFPLATLGQMYLSHDQGLTFEKVVFSPPTISTSSLSWYPMDHDWMLGLDRQNNNTLYVSNNTGTSWTPVASNVADFAWGDPSIDPAQTVYYSAYDPAARMAGDFRVNLFKQQVSRNESGQECDPNLGKFDSFYLTGHYIFAILASGSGDYILQVSYKRQPFQVANFPSVHTQRFFFLDINNLQAVAVLQDQNGVLNLYTSDSTGVNYTLSLEDLVHNAFYIDFNVIAGLNGTMVANQYVRSYPTQSNSPIRTAITFNNGGQWSLIEAPSVDVNGNAINCTLPSCSLHLFMQTSAYATLGVYSHQSALGLIASHGTLGQYLGASPNLFMSRDGGTSWFETLTGSWGLTFLDHGGLIVAAKDYHQPPSGVMKYSTDEGLHWQDFSFSPNVAYVFGVITDPVEASVNVCLFGVEDRTYTWVVWYVNFTAVFPRQCAVSDYYTWSPTSNTHSGQACVLGYEVNIERRLNNVTCLNGPAFSPEITRTNCSCTIQDYECTYGYQMQPSLTSGSCARNVAVFNTCQNTTGYQKIPGNGCWDELYIPPIQCPEITPTTVGSATFTASSAAPSILLANTSNPLINTANNLPATTPPPTNIARITATNTASNPPTNTTSNPPSGQLTSAPSNMPTSSISSTPSLVANTLIVTSVPSLPLATNAADQDQYTASSTAVVTVVTIIIFSVVALIATVAVVTIFMLCRRISYHERTITPSVAYTSDIETLSIGNEYADVHKDDKMKILDTN